MDNYGIFLRKMIEIVAVGDTIIINYQLSIIHFYRTNGAINWNSSHSAGNKRTPADFCLRGF